MRWIHLLAALWLCACAPPNTNWAELGNSPEMQHHADLDQISISNISELDLAWSVEMPAQNGLVGNPLIQDGRIFQGGPYGQIFANDVRTGELLWSFSAEMNLLGTSFVNYGAYHMNRGVALYNDLVIIAANCDLIAVDQRTGQQRWRSQSCDPNQMYGITAAPRVGDGLVFTGNACFDAGATRGYVDAFDAETGERKWRFYTVPGDPSQPQDSELYEMAARTWGTDWYSRTRGCGSAWDAITFDDDLHQLYIGTGSPGPWAPNARAPDAGDELFTNSIIAVDSRTGEYRWHFKQMPNDAWNLESAVGIMVADLPVNGRSRRVVLSVPKNGFAYVLDARTGEFISGGAYQDVAWSSGLDENGRPHVNESAQYWLPGRTSSIVEFTHNWEALALDPESNLLYIPASVMPMRLSRDPNAIVGAVSLDYYYALENEPRWPVYGEVVAWDPVANAVRWRSERQFPPMNGGLMHTSGGLVFQGLADGRLLALDAATGREVWSRQTGGAIRAAPSTVMVEGVQYVIVATGNGAASATGYVSRYVTTPQSRTPPRLLAFRIGGTSEYPPLATPELTPRPLAPRQSATLARAGRGLYEAYGCEVCHGVGGDAPGGRPPNLNHIPPADYAMFRSVVKDGALAANGMPPFAEMPEQDARAIFAYIINRAWDEHDRDQALARPEVR